MGIDVKITYHSKEFLDALEDAKERALEAIGIQAEGHAKVELSNSPKRIDTGLLRNSITHAVSGKPAAQSHYTADKPKDGKTNSGSYGGQAPDDAQKAVYIGTNVEYATYVHDGTKKMKPNRFIKNAVTKNGAEYKAIVERELKT